MLAITFGQQTDIGRVRKMNQDSLAVLSAGDLDGLLDGFFIVADGMGGKAGGEIASRVTVETVPAVALEALSEQTSPLPARVIADALREGMDAANDVVYKQSRANPELRGMGTTCVAAVLRGATAVLGNLGDSRAYLLRSGQLSQVTQDHSLVQEHVRAGELTADEARTSRFKNVITRAIGITSRVEPDIETIELSEGDTLLLCSDGLTNMVREAEIERLLSQSEHPQEACDQLVSAALENGGEDNITAVVIRYGEVTPRPVPAAAAGAPRSNGAASHVETAEPVFTSSPAPAEGSSRRSAAVPLLLLLCLLLGSALFYVGQEVYSVGTTWPFLVRKASPPKPVQPAFKPPVDFAALEYAAPALVTPKALRGNPIVCDSAGNLYGVTAGTGVPVRISPDGTISRLIASGIAPAAPAAAGGRSWALDGAGNLYVSSRAEKRIDKFDTKGTRIGTLGEEELTAPEGVAVDSLGNVYVVDAGHLKVLKAHARGTAPADRRSENGSR